MECQQRRLFKLPSKHHAEQLKRVLLHKAVITSIRYYVLNGLTFEALSNWQFLNRFVLQLRLPSILSASL